MDDQPPPILSYNSPDNHRRLIAWMRTHRRRILQLLVTLAILLLVTSLPYSRRIQQIELCPLCGSQRITAQQWCYYIPLPASQIVRPLASEDVGAVFPPHQHAWCFRSESFRSKSVLRLLDTRWYATSSPPDLSSSALLFLSRLRPTDHLRPIERGQGWLDILLGNDTPAARAILAAQPADEVSDLRKELSDPRWQELLAQYRQLASSPTSAPSP